MTMIVVITQLVKRLCREYSNKQRSTSNHILWTDRI